MSNEIIITAWFLDTTLNFLLSVEKREKVIRMIVEKRHELSSSKTDSEVMNNESDSDCDETVFLTAFEALLRSRVNVTGSAESTSSLKSKTPSKQERLKILEQ